MSTSAADSGTLSLVGGELRYAHPSGVGWAVPVSEIVVIAEYTTAAGPVLDDYFLVVVRPDGSFEAAPIYAAGQEQALEALSAELGASLDLGLANRSDWASRVVWPPELAGQAAFDLRPAAAQGLRARILARFGIGAHEMQLTAPVRAQVLRDRR